MVNSRMLLVMLALGLTASLLPARVGYWQQKVNYYMEVDFNVENHRYEGSQNMTYTNNSPDTLKRVFYHLFFNAFQPGSMMDIRNRTIEDPDFRIGDRISRLKPDEIGYLRPSSLKQDGKKLEYEVSGTILEVTLAEPLLPGATTSLEMTFEGQVPVQIRRSGRFNKEGIAYSMSQWYPKLCEYDFKGWHAHPYVGREFYGVWGDFELKLTLDSSYTVAGTGYLQNPQEIGHGYQKKGKRVKRKKGGKLTWHFIAPQVHDFMWAADQDYIHTVYREDGLPDLHFFYQPSEYYQEAWEQLPEYAAKAFKYINKHFGEYPYKQYSVIQGGDGGMEYPMATLVTGNRSLRSLVGVTVHEALHSWYQMVLGSNEALHPWMDEGFTSFATHETMQYLYNESGPAHQGSYNSYFGLVEAGAEDAMSTHSDHYHTNSAYGMAAYSKGTIFLEQLKYVIGVETVYRSLRRYFNTWKFRHPAPNDFIRIAEKESGLELDWYLEYFVNSTHTIDYGLRTLIGVGDTTFISLEKLGRMPMPIEVEVAYSNGRKLTIYIPLRIMRGIKQDESEANERVIAPDWPWTHPTYMLAIPGKASEIRRVEIDPSGRMADIDRSNNVLEPAGLGGSRP